MKLYIYCEANSETGLGHFIRCNRLLENLRKFKKIEAVILTKNTRLAKKIFKNCKILALKTKLKDYFKNFYKKTILILDPPYYPHGKDKEETIDINLNNNNIRVVRLTDEFKAKNHECDILINDFPGSKKFLKIYKKNSRIKKLFLGQEYFLYNTTIEINKSKKEYVIVAFGGLDTKNLLKKYFEIIKNIKKKVIIFYHKKFQIKNKNIKILKHDYKNFQKYLFNCDYFISTPSNIMFEASIFNVKGITIPTHDRQLMIAKNFKKKNIIKFKKLYDNVSKINLQNAIKKIEKIKSKKKFSQILIKKNMEIYRNIIKLYD